MKKERIHKYYENIAVEDLLIIYNYKNIMELPRFEKIILSTTSKKFLSEKKNIIDTFGGCFLLSGQKGILKQARKSVAGFKLRKGNIIGCMCTLRGKAMYAFLDKIITFGIPSITGPFFGLLKQALLCFPFGAKRSMRSTQYKAQQSFDMPDSSLNIPFRLRAFFSQGKIELAKIEIINWSRKNKSVVDAWKKQNASGGFDKNIKYFNMGVKSVNVAKTFPEYENFFPIFDSIRGFNTVWSLSFPSITDFMRANKPCKRNLIRSHDCGSSDFFSSARSFVDNSFLEYHQINIATCIQKSSLLIPLEKKQSHYLFLPTQKMNVFLSQFQCPNFVLT